MGIPLRYSFDKYFRHFFFSLLKLKFLFSKKKFSRQKKNRRRTNEEQKNLTKKKV